MKISLKVAHEHNGTKYAAGQIVPDVPLLDALWLKAADVIDEGIEVLKAEVRKLEGKDQQAAHAAALNKAIAADAARTPVASSTAAPTKS